MTGRVLASSVKGVKFLSSFKRSFVCLEGTKQVRGSSDRKASKRDAVEVPEMSGCCATMKGPPAEFF